MAEGLAGVSAGALLLYNFTALEQNVVRFDRETDVVYAHDPRPVRPGRGAQPGARGAWD